MKFAGYVGHAPIYFYAYYCVLFSSKVWVRVRITCSVCLVSGWAHAFILLFVVIAPLLAFEGRGSAYMDARKASSKVRELLYHLTCYQIFFTFEVHNILLHIFSWGAHPDPTGGSHSCENGVTRKWKARVIGRRRL